MFKKSELFGREKRNIDERHGIILPSFTEAEEKDEICIVLENDYAFKIYNYNVIKEKLERYNRYIRDAEKRKKSRELLELEIKRDLCSMGIVSKQFITSGNRILLSDHLLNKYNLKDSVIICGSEDHVKIFSSDENVEEYEKYVSKKFMLER